jgi:hypothetical protein
MDQDSRMDLIAYWTDDILEDMNVVSPRWTKGDMIASINAWKNSLKIIKSITEEK